MRNYGNPPFRICLIHGGPGAAGDMQPVANELIRRGFSIIEPMQTEATLEGQIEELKVIIDHECVTPVALVGYSWGAWLSYLVAAKYPEAIEKLILVSSGPLEQKYVSMIMDRRMARYSSDEKAEVEYLMKNINKLDQESFARFGFLIDQADTFASLPLECTPVDVNEKIYKGVWPQAELLRKSGQLVKLAERIQCPVHIIQGRYDPRPLVGVYEPLKNVIQSLSFDELDKCGHTPWREKWAHEKFFEILVSRLQVHN